MAKYFIHEDSGTVYWVENNEIWFSPLCKDGTFNTEDGGIVETWEENPQDEQTVKTALGIN